MLIFWKGHWQMLIAKVIDEQIESIELAVQIAVA
jgi:hypothetical protein